MTALKDVQKAHEFYQAGNLQEAENLCLAVLEDEPDLAKAWQLRALIARAGNDLQNAEAHIKTALSFSPDDAESLNTYGNILKLTGRFPAAIEAYKQSLEQAPNYLSAAQNLGQLYLMTKDPMEAANVFSVALSHHQGHPVMMQGLLYALKDSQQTDAALNLLSQMPQGPEIGLTAGQLFAQNGQTLQAKAAFAQGLAHPQTATLASRNLIQLVRMKEGDEAAKQAISELVGKNPEAGFLYITGSDLLRDMGDGQAALDLLGQCESKFGPQPDIDLMRADIAIGEGDGQKAFQLSEAGLKQRPGDLGLMSSYARGALMTGAFDNALQTTRHAQMRFPFNQFWIAIEATALRGLGQDQGRLNNYETFVRSFEIEAPPEYNSQSEFLADLKTSLEGLHNNKFSPFDQSLRGGTQTSADLRFAAERPIQEFFQALRAPIFEYMAHIGVESGHPLTRRNTGKYRVTGAWSVRLEGQGFHVNHVHPEGWISSSFYVEVPEGTENHPEKKGWIKFGEPPFEVPNQSYEHIIAPKPGRLVLFPSYMWHGTIPTEEKSVRMALPFDAVPA